MISRRDFLKGAMATSVLAATPGCKKADEVRWSAHAYRKPERSRVAVLRADAYDERLEHVVADGVRLLGADMAGKRVVLKPNLVEFDPEGVINTHPMLIAATVSALRMLGARDVTVAEGPGHRRDNEYLLTASGLLDVLRDHDARYVDLNIDDVVPVALDTRFTRMGRLHLPRTVVDADVLISMPKLKTHHWAGATLSMKNMFGIMPGSVYGWPKNPLHWEGISQSIVDINGALRMQRFAIVDGIVGMEGNGPIQGDAKRCGVLVFGDDWVAVDATSARLMKIDPYGLEYLAMAESFLGNVARTAIDQLGEDPEPLAQDFRVLDKFQKLKESIA